MKSTLNKLSPSALEFKISQHEKARPGSTSPQMTAWQHKHNDLLAQLHKLRVEDYH